MPIDHRAAGRRHSGRRRRSGQPSIGLKSTFGWWRYYCGTTQGEDLLPKLRDHLLSERPLTLFQDEHVNADRVPTFERLRKSMRLFPEFCQRLPAVLLLRREMVAHEDPHYSRANRVIGYREKSVFDECRRCIAIGSAADSFLCAGVHGDFIV